VSLVAARNEGRVLYFSTTRDSGEDEWDERAPTAFWIRLSGRAGNPYAAGARVTVTYHDGSTVAAEVHAGSGHASQSSPSLMFQLGQASGWSDVNSIEVRWPDGDVTHHDRPGYAGLQVIYRP